MIFAFLQILSIIEAFKYYSFDLFSVSPIARLEHLDQLIISNKIDSMKESSLLCADISNGQKVSVETLLDVLIVLYDECQNSSLRREKTVSEFIELS